jgi:hypothetical protein
VRINCPQICNIFPPIIRNSSVRINCPQMDVLAKSTILYPGGIRSHDP